MRTSIGGNGQDTTAARIAYLKANNELTPADLYLIGELEDPNAIWLTNWDSDLVWSAWGTFHAAVVSRGKVKSEIGLTVQTLQVDWTPTPAAFGTSIATANPTQRAQLGFYDNWTFRMWRCVMPTPGDANTYGAMEWFGGRIADIVVDRGKISFTVNSFLDVINQKVPQNVIENTNILAGYAGATPAAGDTAIAQFSVAAVGGQTQEQVIASCTSPSSGHIYGTNAFQYGYMVFNPGSSLAGMWAPVALNKLTVVGGINYNLFNLFSPLPFVPTPGDTFYVSAKAPVDSSEGTLGVDNISFPFVPSPEQGF